MVTAGLDVTETIVELERAALERWGRGDPDGFLEISAPDLSYFDPFIERRLDGLAALRSMYEQIRGKIHIDRFESHGSESSMHWNTTEVYRRDEAGWRIIHTHWAFHQPRLAG